MKPVFLLLAVLMTMPSHAADAPVPPDAARKPHVVTGGNEGIRLA